ncbi:hypothetical protein [Franconibacter daqui]|uniref:hypothetical protein n=1 Tax=Franconibacter daqui TaxID=2047724 RepID=UPI002DBCC561|nr:hypothetical protein [Franconibacter daqui]MEB5922749.1 hypothetical protein [Franconibacter daqui]
MMKKNRLTARQQYQLDIELIKSKPMNRTEAKAQLAAKLRIQNYKGKKAGGGAKNAKASLEKANALRFGERIVESVDTERISDSSKRWRGRTAD